MISTFSTPVLSVAADVVKDLEGGDALSGLWTRESSNLTISIADTSDLLFVYYICSFHKVQGKPPGWATPRKHIMAYVVS